MKPLRRSQLISPWGIGSMIDFPDDESLMICGLDAWPFAVDECPSNYKIVEERLQVRLQVDHFRLPPEYQLPAPGVQYPQMKIPCVRFPLWNFCPYCGNMRMLGLFGGAQKCDGPNFAEGLTCYTKPERRRLRLVPMRFVVVCEKGHIRDFPWMEWVHRDKPIAAACRLRVRAGRSASLAGIRIGCECGQSQSLAGSFDVDALSRLGLTCGGEMPWLGSTNCDPARCGQRLQVVQRGASNVYFAHVMSSIYLPLWGEQASRDIVRALENPQVWSVLSQGTVNGRIDLSRCEIIAELRGLDATKLQEVAQRKLEGRAESDQQGTSEESYRQAEYSALLAGRGTESVDLFSTRFDPREYDAPVNSHFGSISLVYKLRETRAFLGFSRIVPDDSRPIAAIKSDLYRDSRINWLPAITVRGEGIFVNLPDEKLRLWSAQKHVVDRANQLAAKYNQARTRRGLSTRQVSAKFILLHTLSHLIINQLSYDCGYGSSSLRERLFCDTDEPAHPMSGFLIYTASGDSEGTMGGLVRQGAIGRLENTLIRALRAAEWCSADPVCAESNGQGPDSCNLAACHGCALLPETSCEEGNRLLDRALVVGSPIAREIGFFSDCVASIRSAP